MNGYKKRNIEKAIFVFLLVAVFVSLLLMGVGFLKEPMMGTDEGVYLIIANTLKNGGRIYVDAWDHKPPLIFLIYEICLIVYNSIISVHVLALLMRILTAVLLFFIVKKILGKWPALFSIWLYALYSSIFWAASANVEIFLLPAHLGTILLLFRFKDTGKKNYLAWAGIVIGFAVALKLISVFLLIGAFIWIYHIDMRRSELKKVSKEILIFLSFSCLFPALILLYVLTQGIFKEFISAVFQYNKGYVFDFAFKYFIKYGIPFIENYLVSQWFVILLCVLGIIFMLFFDNKVNKRDEIELVAVFFVASIIATVAPLKFLDHYFLLILPFLIFFAAYPFVIGRNRLLKITFLLLVIAFTFPMASSRLKNSLNRWNKTLSDSVYSKYRGYVLGRYVMEHTKKQERVYGWHIYYIDFYFYANRLSASRYFFWPHLMRQPLPPRAKELFCKDFASHPPAIIVIGKTDFYPDKTFAPFEKELKYNYVFDKKIDKFLIFKRKVSHKKNFLQE